MTLIIEDRTPYANRNFEKILTFLVSRYHVIKIENFSYWKITETQFYEESYKYL